MRPRRGRLPTYKADENVDDQKIKELEEHVRDSERGRETAVQRFDAIILALGTVSIGYIANYLKDFAEENPCTDISFARAAQLLLLIAILSNLVSQVTSLATHVAYSWHSRYRLRLIRGELKEMSEKRLQWKIDSRYWFGKIFHWTTNGFNVVSFVTLVAGILIFVLFTYKL
jgi:predicted HTH domain antitoxin